MTPPVSKRKRDDPTRDDGSQVTDGVWEECDARLSPQKVRRKVVRWSTDDDDDDAEGNDEGNQEGEQTSSNVRFLSVLLLRLWRGTSDMSYWHLPKVRESRNDVIQPAHFSNSGRVGCAYYDPVKCVIFVLEDTQETSHFDLTKMRE